MATSPAGVRGETATLGFVATDPDDLPSDPAVVVTNPHDDVTVETFTAWLDRRLGYAPTDPGVRAVDTLAEARAAGEV